MKRLLSGNEAAARAAWEAGCTVASGYPGTPSTEILENFALFPGVYAEWAPNEKVGVDVALGAAYTGRRALSTMKHVGLNVALDAFYGASMTGIEAGLVIVSGDDPGMHSSQNEQDNRQIAKFARVPCLDPSDSQDVHDLMLAAFDISEQFDTPVLFRMTTRVCHTSSPVEILDKQFTVPEPGKYPRNTNKYCTIPANARRRHPVIEQRIADLSEYAETFPLNKTELRGTKLGIVTSGVAYNYARQVFPDASVLKLGMTYPIPPNLVRSFAEKVDKLIVLEELDPFLEDQIRLLGIDLYTPAQLGYPDTKSIFPICGELDPAVVERSAVKAGLLESSGQTPAKDESGVAFPIRPPVLCPGCPHRSAFYVLQKLGVPVNGDIGCYTLGMADPLDALHTVSCMGASVGIAHGAAVAGDKERHVAVIGDSTFFHSAIPALINVLYNKSNVITIIMDNRVTGMTGHQQNPGTGYTLQNQPTRVVDIETLVRAIGFNEVVTLPAYDVKSIEKKLKEWMKSEEPAVLITKEECALLPTARARYLPLEVTDNCNGCTICFRIGCPAILKSEKLDPKMHRPLAEIDPLLCTGCEICAQVCPRDAILFRKDRQPAEVK